MPKSISEEHPADTKDQRTNSNAAQEGEGPFHSRSLTCAAERLAVQARPALGRRLERRVRPAAGRDPRLERGNTPPASGNAFSSIVSPLLIVTPPPSPALPNASF